MSSRFNDPAIFAFYWTLRKELPEEWEGIPHENRFRLGMWEIFPIFVWSRDHNDWVYSGSWDVNAGYDHLGHSYGTASSPEDIMKIVNGSVRKYIDKHGVN